MDKEVLLSNHVGGILARNCLNGNKKIIYLANTSAGVGQSLLYPNGSGNFNGDFTRFPEVPRCYYLAN
jgi:hypothetical protein